MNIKIYILINFNIIQILIDQQYQNIFHLEDIINYLISNKTIPLFQLIQFLFINSTTILQHLNYFTHTKFQLIQLIFMSPSS